MDGQPFPLRQDVESETSGGRRPGPQGNKNTAAFRGPSLSGSPEAWPRG